ncbi:MAG TPA: hypothetical protein VEH55_09595 [Gaiellaceae bacterium]|nr:hypothetical protein [Gaiellaceae bacterium]
MAARITKRRVLVGLIGVFVLLGVLSVLLPYVGGGSSGLTKLFP